MDLTEGITSPNIHRPQSVLQPYERSERCDGMEQCFLAVFLKFDLRLLIAFSMHLTSALDTYKKILKKAKNGIQRTR